MFYRALDLVFSPPLGRIDDEPLQRLLHGHRVVAVREHFYTHNGLPHLMVGVTYEFAALEKATSKDTQRRKPSPAKTCPQESGDWGQILQPEAEPLFQTLRAWRTSLARQQGAPPYVIMTNAQLALVANARPETNSALSQIPGLGEKRLAKFGNELLQVINTGVIPDPPAVDDPSSPPDRPSTTEVS